jgi:hypothetical protein
MRAVRDKANNDTNIPPSFLPGSTFAGSDPDAAHRGRVIFIKAKMKQAFPQTFDEALNPAPLTPLRAYQAYLGNLGITGSSSATQLYESSACLLMALQFGEGGVKSQDLGVGSAVSRVSLNGKEIEILVDGWKSPLVFCRWPTGSGELNPGGAQPGKGNDPYDPEGYLTYAGWLNGPGRAAFQQYFHGLPNRDASNQPFSYNLTPLIISAGPDKQLGLDFITAGALNASANDNIYSSRLP